jgi:spore coat polysaccharide biosynthesis protein SpsF (cytidylyltransferase family)
VVDLTSPIFLAIIQARMGSSRLPGKSLRELNGKPLIDHVIERALFAFEKEKTVLATTNRAEDDELASHVTKRFGIEVYRGDSQDVRSRFLQIGKMWGAEAITRITADDPFKDPHHLRLSQESLLVSDVDYYNNFEPKIYPIGMDVESFRFYALQTNARVDHSIESIEHVTFGLRKQASLRRFHETGVPEFITTRLTIDTEKDFMFCERVAKKIGLGENFDWHSTRRALISLGINESRED